MSELLLSSQMISYEIQIICLTSQAVQCSATQHRLPVEQRQLDFWYVSSELLSAFKFTQLSRWQVEQLEKEPFCSNTDCDQVDRTRLWWLTKACSPPPSWWRASSWWPSPSAGSASTPCPSSILQRWPITICTWMADSSDKFSHKHLYVLSGIL